MCYTFKLSLLGGLFTIPPVSHVLPHTVFNAQLKTFVTSSQKNINNFTSYEYSIHCILEQPSSDVHHNYAMVTPRYSCMFHAHRAFSG